MNTDEVIQGYPDEVRPKVEHLRALILETAASLDEVGPPHRDPEMGRARLPDREIQVRQHHPVCLEGVGAFTVRAVLQLSDDAGRYVPHAVSGTALRREPGNGVRGG